jgi:hypothetical protein
VHTLSGGQSAVVAHAQMPPVHTPDEHCALPPGQAWPASSRHVWSLHVACVELPHWFCTSHAPPVAMTQSGGPGNAWHMSVAGFTQLAGVRQFVTYEHTPLVHVNGSAQPAVVAHVEFSAPRHEVPLQICELLHSACDEQLVGWHVPLVQL